MKTVLITGSEGFIGKNLRLSLQRRGDVRLLAFDVQNEPDELATLLKQADFVFHLAGVNRPQDPEEFRIGNAGLTEQICRHLHSSGRRVPVAIASSIQARMDNPYGVSKRAAEEAIFRYAAEASAAVYVFRLPNVFGKWCRPNYNSGVATFCHNIAHGLPIQVNDPSVVMNLVYIDDVVCAFESLLEGRCQVEDRYCLVQPVHTRKLGEIAELVTSFRQSRERKNIPCMADPFVKKLYSTYLSYLPGDDFSYPLHMNRDDRGSFTEFLRTEDRGQVSVNISKPGVTKGNHWHQTKNEKFLVVSGEAVIRFRKVCETQVIEYHVSGEKLEVVDIPTGYTHNITNVGESNLVTIMWCNESFDPDHPDTIYEAV